MHARGVDKPPESAARAPWHVERHFVFWTISFGVVTALAMLDGQSSDAVKPAFFWAATGLVVSGGLALALRRRSMLRARDLVVTIAVGTVLWVLLLALVGAWAGNGDEDSAAEVTANVIFMLFVMTGATVWHASLQHRRAREQAELGARAARDAATRAELAMLRMQLEPHFLGNALTAAATCIDEDPARAQQMLASIADLLRAGLAPGDAPPTLGAELRRIEQYLAIERARFEDALRVTVDVPEAIRAHAVPPLLLHSLVENAIRHGMRTSEPPLEVSIVARVADARLVVGIVNGGTLTPTGGGTGLGLRNARARLEVLYPGRYVLSLDQGDGKVRLHLSLDGAPCFD